MPKLYRDATTGQFTTAEDAAARPAETVAETVEARHETPDVAELRRLAEAATPGPWEAFGAVDGRRGERWLGVTTDMRATESARAGDVFAAQDCTRQDALFIAAANPAAVLGLLDHLAHMREARDNARAEVKRVTALVEAVREYAAARQANIDHGPLLSARKAAHDALLAALARLDEEPQPS